MKPLNYMTRLQIARDTVKHFQQQVDALYPNSGEYTELYLQICKQRDNAVRDYANFFTNANYLSELPLASSPP